MSEQSQVLPDNNQAMPGITLKEALVSSRTRLIACLTRELETGDFEYKTFGTKIEKPIIDELIKIFTEGGYIRTEEDYKKAENKNQFPDFIVLSSPPPLAIEIKAGCHHKKKRNQWVDCKNSNNDLGTLLAWGGKIQKFGGENIYYIFVEYDVDASEYLKIIDVKIEPFYKFLDKNRSGTLKYREKDGNLRPKNFSSPSSINSFEDFSSLIKPTIIYRSKQIIKKHVKILPENERNLFLDELKI